MLLASSIWCVQHTCSCDTYKRHLDSSNLFTFTFHQAMSVASLGKPREILKVLKRVFAGKYMSECEVRIEY